MSSTINLENTTNTQNTLLPLDGNGDVNNSTFRITDIGKDKNAQTDRNAENTPRLKNKVSPSNEGGFKLPKINGATSI
jgi:hypothetical protein